MKCQEFGLLNKELHGMPAMPLAVFKQLARVPHRPVADLIHYCVSVRELLPCANCTPPLTGIKGPHCSVSYAVSFFF